METENTRFKSGFVTLIGRPNVGKSTLMNHLIGQKIAITSSKPQTTRNRIQTVYTSDQGQIIFLDTPGIHKAKNKLGEYMVEAAEQTLREVDVVLWLVEPTEYIGKGEQHIARLLQKAGVPVILIMNKMDTVDKREIPRCMDAYRELFAGNDGGTAGVESTVGAKNAADAEGTADTENSARPAGSYRFADMIPVCALRGLHMDEVIQAIFRYLPYGPKFYDDDTVTDQPQRQIVAELIREKVLRCMDEEIPHGIAVAIEVMKERPAGSQKKKDSRAEAVRRRNRHRHDHGDPANTAADSVQKDSGDAEAVSGEKKNGWDPAGRREQAETDVRRNSDWIMDIEATIICEKDSHKGMIIGKQGAMLRKIGSQARYEIEQMLEEPVNLQLWVKVKKDWRDSDFMIKNFGYDKKELES
ncbi:MAG: GTPase Era [Lachnospiraceae bacterium]|nr:GTPase Era [Lachnospiraceae bacterium]